MKKNITSNVFGENQIRKEASFLNNKTAASFSTTNKIHHKALKTTLKKRKNEKMKRREAEKKMILENNIDPYNWYFNSNVGLIRAEKTQLVFPGFPIDIPLTGLGPWGVAELFLEKVRDGDFKTMERVIEENDIGYKVASACKMMANGVRRCFRGRGRRTRHKRRKKRKTRRHRKGSKITRKKRRKRRKK